MIDSSSHNIGELQTVMERFRDMTRPFYLLAARGMQGERQHKAGFKLIRERVLGFVFLTFFSSTLPILGQSSSLNVTNFGAKGDAVQIQAMTLSNSPNIFIQSTNQFSNSDIGKIVILFGVGIPTTPTNNQDVLAMITQVINPTNLIISAPCGRTTNLASGLCGTQNSQPFQNCVNASYGTNALVQIPDGHYLLIPPFMLNTNSVALSSFECHQAVTIQKGGIHFLGNSRDGTVLVGCGAWQLKGPVVQRGFIFFTQGPVTNDAPLIFENITMDGGLANGIQPYRGWPAQWSDGSGWDVTHGAVLDIGQPPFHAFKAFRNCRITHWRGEMLKSVVGAVGVDGFIEISNCGFDDGNASAMNFTFTHHISGCTFSDCDMAMEFYEGYMKNPSLFELSTITNVRAALIIVGALTNHVEPSYIIRSNSISANAGGWGVFLNPARNVIISANMFYGTATGVLAGGSGKQGTDQIGNILIESNSFLNCSQPYLCADATDNVMIRYNTATRCGQFAIGWGTSTNTLFLNNRATNGSSGFDSTRINGQSFIDDLSNDFPFVQNNDFQGKTNGISYGYGMRQYIWVSKTNSLWVLDDTKPQWIPPGATIILQNYKNGQTCPAKLYLNAARSGNPLTLAVGQTVTCLWTNGSWQLVRPASPVNFHLLPASH